MNIFYLSDTPKTAATMHCDKHVVKMIVETAQLLSTAHRINDGELVTELSDSGRRIKRYKLKDDREQVMYKSTHANHPSAVWVRASKENYSWTVRLFLELLNEYKHRYNRDHACVKLIQHLRFLPNNISNTPFTQPPQAMPDYCKVPGDSIKAYRNYYNLEKKRFARWTNREIPQWFNK